MQNASRMDSLSNHRRWANLSICWSVLSIRLPVKALSACRRCCHRTTLTGSVRGVEDNLRAPGPMATRYTGADDPGGYFGDYCNWSRIAPFKAFVQTGPLGEIAARLTGAARVQLFTNHVLVKEPGTREATPWHHDQPYYLHRRRPGGEFLDPRWTR